MLTHEQLLAQLGRPWLDIVPSRRRLARAKLPRHASEPSPNVLVVAHPSEISATSLRVEYEHRDRTRRLDIQHVPSEWMQQIELPAGERLLIFTWVNWRGNSRDRFEQFCAETGRTTGTLDLDGTVRIGEQTIPITKCRLVSQDDLRPRPPKTIKPRSAKAILAQAETLLKHRSSQREDIDCREMYDDEEAHDDQLQQTLEEELRATLARYEKALTTRYGRPIKEGPDEHRDIPINGVLRHVIWTVGPKSLYLTLSHEDRELPWVISMGTRV